MRAAVQPGDQREPGAAPLAAAQTLAATRQVSSGTTLVLIATEGESANPVALPSAFEA